VSKTSDILTVSNPATGKIVARLPADNAARVRAKFRAARAAQPAWAALPLKQRIAALRRFHAALVTETESLAVTLTTEVGKPIRQARNEVKGVLDRIDFFIAAAPRTLAPEVVHDERSGGGRLTERITAEPLGVVANI